MIIKARSISKEHAINALNYVIKEEKDHLLLDYDGADISSAFAFVGDCSTYKKDRVKNAFVSTVISPHPDDNLSLEDMRPLLHAVLKEMKLNNRQFFAVIHQNTNAPHIHVISNRIDYDFNTWDDHKVLKTCQDACRDVSKQLGLIYAKDLLGSYQGQGKAKKSGYDEKREGDITTIRRLFKEVKYKALDIDYVFHHLRDNGVDVQVKEFKNNLFGVSFEYNGTKVKASKVDRMLSVEKDEENGGYKANKRFQKVIDRNLDRMLGKRLEMDLLNDLNDESQRDYTKEDFNLEIPVLIQFNMDRYWNQIKQQNEEDKQKYLARKYGRRHRPIGFKKHF